MKLLTALIAALILTDFACAAERVRIMTYNIRQGMGPDTIRIHAEFDIPLIDRHVELGPWQPPVPRLPGKLDDLADRIKAEDPDVVMLQEITNSCAMSLGVHQVRRIAERLGMHAHYGVAHESAKGSWWLTMGNAVLSKYPLSEKQVVLLNEDEGALNVRCVTIAKVAHPAVPGGFFAASTHLASKSQDMRMRQVPVLVGALARLQGPVVIAGDFNAQPKNPVISTIRETMAQQGHPLVDAFGAVGEGEGRSYPTKQPDRRIDYILAETALTPVSARVLTGVKESDHLPVIAEFDAGNGDRPQAPISLLGLRSSW